MTDDETMPPSSAATPTANTPTDAVAPDDDAAVGPGGPLRLPPDPAAYDSERNALARARGLAAPYIAGGRDPEPEAGRREERFYARLLLVMVAIIVIGGFVLGIVANVITALGGR